MKKLLFPSKQVYFRFPFLSSSVGFQSKNIVTLAFAIKYKGRKSTQAGRLELLPAHWSRPHMDYTQVFKSVLIKTFKVEEKCGQMQIIQF